MKHFVRSLKEKTAEEKLSASETALRDDLVEAAASNVEIDIPDVMIDSEVDRMMEEFGQRLQSQGMNLDFTSSSQVKMKKHFVHK